MADLSYLFGCIMTSILIWVIPYRNMRVDSRLALLYPVTILAITVTAYQSLYYTLSGKLSWKGRQITNTNWKWF
jgi:hypothetical protein